MLEFGRHDRPLALWCCPTIGKVEHWTDNISLKTNFIYVVVND